MPVGTAISLLVTPLVIKALGWSACWWLLAGVAWLAAWMAWRLLPADVSRQGLESQAFQDAERVWLRRLHQTLTAKGPWLLALMFGMYAAQWITVIGFLPSVYAQAGIGHVAGVLTALVALANIVGNVGSGRLLHHGRNFARTAGAVLGVSFAVMALASVVTFAQVDGLAFGWRYVAVLLFSAVGGAIPGTLFALSVKLAPSEGAVGTTVGWMQQGSSAGQVVLPPVAGWLAQSVGGWHWTWTLTLACALIGLAVSAMTGRLLSLKLRERETHAGAQA